MGLTKAQRNQILTTTEITSATKALTVGQIEERIATELNSKEDAKAITQKLTKIGIISSESGATTSLTVDILEQAVANGTLTVSEASSIASALGLTVANTSLSVSFKVLTSTIWANIKALLVWLTTNPVGWTILATSALYGLAKVFVENTTSIEEAKEETKKYVDTLSSINSEVENLESRLKDLNNQINNLNPITDAEDIENLKLESAELENQLAILKEKQRLANIEADKASQESLSMTQTSRYDFGEGKTHNALTGETLEYKTAVEVTRMKELQNAMDAYDEYANEQSELRAELAKLAESGEYTQEEWDNFEASINDLDIKMQETRTHASELASELNEEKKGLNGVDESSKKLLEDTNSVLNSYSAWTDEINTTTNALKENSNVQSSTLDNKNPVLFSEQLTQIQALSEGFEQLDSIMADVKDGKEFDYSSILGNEDFTKVFGEYTEEYENFIKTISNSPDDISKCKSAFDELATTYVYGSGALENLTEETKNAAILDLEQMGISNAAEIVESILNPLSRYAEALKIAETNSIDLTNVKDGEIKKLIEEGKVSEETAEEFFYYALQKQLASDSGLSTDEECQQLLNLANQTKTTAEVLGKFIDLLNIIKSDSWGEATKDLAKKELQKMLAEIEKVDVKGYSGGSKTKDSSSSKSTQKEVDIMAELNSEMDEYQSKLEAVKSARETYNEYGKITVDQAQDIIDADFRLLEAYGSEEEALERLGKAKLNEMQIQLARNALDTINSITSEAMAADYLAGANENLAKSYESVTEAMLKNAAAEAERRGVLQGQAAQTILKGYQNGAMMLGQVDFGFNLQEAENAKKEQEKAAKETTKEFKKMVDWIEKFLDNLSRKTDKLMDKIDKFLSWQKKNSMINRAIKSTDNEITQNQKAYQAYMKKANSVGLSKKYINMIQNGSLNVETITDEGLSNKVDDYLEWYEKARDVKDSIEELYEQERELIHQKLDNVIDYYSDMDSYLSSVTSKIESLIDLNESMGKRSSLTELVKQFSDVSAQLSNVTQKTSEIKTNVTEINFGESESVKDAIAKNRQEQIDSIQAELDNLYLSSETSGTYKKLELDIKKKEDKIKDYENKGWDETKSKQYDKLWAELDDLYDLQAELDAYATSNNISNYKKVYTKFQKLENKIDSGKDLTKSEQKKYNSYWEQLEEMRISADNEINSLKAELGLLEGTIAPETNVEKAEKDLLSVQEKLEDTATYQKLEQNIEKTENKIADLLDGREYDELSKKQKKTYDKLTKTLEDYYDRKKALDENATADNVAEYNKIYIAWKKLQDKLDVGKNLSTSQWKQYNKYTEQLKEFEQAKDALVSDLEGKLDEARNPKDKLEIIKAEYEKSAEGIYDSYQRQIDGVKDAIKETAQYQNLLANIQKLEQKKDTTGLSASEEASLEKQLAKLEALEEGASVENLSDYISTWDKFYKLQQKLDKNGTLSDTDSKNYDTYKAKLEKWNEEKQQQISDLTSMMEDELEALQKTYVENVSEAESEISEYYANLYDLAKQIAEYNLGTLEEQLALLDSYISYYQQIVDLYSKFSDDKLAKILSDLDIDVVEGQDALYAEYLEQLQKKYDTTLSKINEYKELLGALDEDNFESSMQLFKKTMETYRANGEEDKANQLQKVLDLLNERAVDANNWGEYADEWANEWEKALADAKTELIGIAGSIQDVNDQLREIKFSNITGAITELSNAQDMLSSIIGLINDDWMFNADGDLTQYGLTKVGLLVEQMEQAKQEANKYAELIQSIESMRNTYASEDAYKQAMHEAKMNYLTSLGDLQNYQDSIVSILTKADEAVVNSLKDVIEKRKEALRKKKELYDYDKSIKSSQKEIDSIKAQIHALESLSDTTDAATKAKLAQLNADLLEKEEALKETKDEHTYNLQIDALDEFLESLNDTMNNTTDSINKSFETYIEAINSALKLYGENKEWLNDWSNEVLDTVTGMGNTVGGSGVDLDVSSKDTSTVTEKGNITSDDIHFYGTGKNENIQKLIDYFTNNSVLVRAEESPLLTANPEMMNFMQNYVPQMAVSVNHTIPEMMRNRESAVVNLHCDSMLTVNGNVDKDTARLLPKQLEQAADYTISKIYNERRRLM